MQEIVKFAKIAKEVWDALAPEKQERLKKFFHLRPTNSGITIISTLPFAPMRGITGLQDPKELHDKLEDIFSMFDILVGQDKERAQKACKEQLRFKIRPESHPEEKIQAIMINTMSNDTKLKEVLGAYDKIRFVASELIIKREDDGGRIDIVGYDGKDIYFFELKKERTKRVDQLSKYIRYYKENENNKKILDTLLKNYPINNVESYEDIKGVMVMKYAENSTEDWKKIAEEKEVDIIFYQPSLNYIAPK